MKNIFVTLVITFLVACTNETTNRPTPPDTTTMPADPALQGDSLNINSNTGTYPTDNRRTGSDSVSGTPEKSRRTTPGNQRRDSTR